MTVRRGKPGRQDPQGGQGNGQRFFHQIPHVQKHADGDEKDAGKDVPERQDVAQGLMAVLCFRENQPGQKGSQGQRQAGRGRAPGHHKAEHQHRQEKHLPIPGAGNLIQHPGNQPLGGENHQNQDAQALQEQADQSTPHTPPVHTRQKRSEQHHGRHNKVLKNQHP